MTKIIYECCVCGRDVAPGDKALILHSDTDAIAAHAFHFWRADGGRAVGYFEAAELFVSSWDRIRGDRRPLPAPKWFIGEIRGVKEVAC